MKKNETTPVTVGVLREELGTLRKEFKGDLGNVRIELKTELKDEIGSVRSELKEEIKLQEVKFEKFVKVQGKSFERQLNAIDGHFQHQNELMAESIMSIHDKIDALTEMVGKNTEDIEIIKLNMELIRGDLKTKVDREEFRALEKRVFFLERKAAKK